MTNRQLPWWLTVHPRPLPGGTPTAVATRDATIAVWADHFRTWSTATGRAATATGTHRTLLNVALTVGAVGALLPWTDLLYGTALAPATVTLLTVAFVLTFVARAVQHLVEVALWHLCQPATRPVHEGAYAFVDVCTRLDGTSNLEQSLGRLDLARIAAHATVCTTAARRHVDRYLDPVVP